jgi:hypothetical protein
MAGLQPTEYRLNAAEWLRLTRGERAQRCRAMAGEMRSLADCAPPSVKEGYLKIASIWLELAEEMDGS